MQINGLGNSQSGDMRYQNSRPQYQSTSDKAADDEESVILTLSTEAVEKSKELKSVELMHPKAKAEAEAETVDWLQQIIQRVKAFFVKIWNEDSAKVEDESEITSEMDNLAQEDISVSDDTQVQDIAQMNMDSSMEEIRPLQDAVQADKNLQQNIAVQQEEKIPPREEAARGTFGELLRPFIEMLRHFLANPFSEEPLVPQPKEQPRAQQDDFAEYVARNGWDESQMAHQMQMKSQLWDTYNRQGQPTRMTQEAPSNLSMKR